MKWAALTVLIAAALAGCGIPSDTVPVSVTAPGPAIVALEQIPVKGRAPKTGYDRDKFAHWSDADRDGCDTREEILERDAVEMRTSTTGCVDVSIIDPYSGQRVDGRGNIDIDHVVALGDAWQKGAQSLTALERQWFANDPANLLAVDRGLNRQKGDSDAASWLPPRTEFRCGYVAKQITIKQRYRLWVTQSERDAMAGILATCPNQELLP